MEKLSLEEDISEDYGVPKRVRDKLWKLPNGVSEVGGYRVVKDKSMVLVTEVPPEKERVMDINIVAFPRAEHFPEFEKASRGVEGYGSALINPTGIGTISITRRPGEPYILRYAQSHYLTEGNPRLTDASLGLKRKLATRYHGWRKRAIKEAIKLVKRENTSLIVTKQGLRGSRKLDVNGRSQFEREVREVAWDMGASSRFLERSRHYATPHLHINPKPRRRR